MFRRMNRRDAAEWASADTVPDLGQLMARWLSGDLKSWPGYQPNCRPDDETREILAALIRANRRGYVTTCSQPGVDDPHCRYGHWRQRAAVQGHADRRTLGAIRTAAARNGLDVLVDSRREIATTIDGRGHTDFGGRLRRRDMSAVWGGIARTAHQALLDAHEIAIIHPDYGPAGTQPLIRTLNAI